MSAPSLMQPLFDGPVDIVGDVHGDIVALRSLLTHLGYSNDGSPPEGRRLVFLGDLTDRAPAGLAVVQLVRRLVNAGLAQCVLGNHDLNILLEKRKPENQWFFDDVSTSIQATTSDAAADEEMRRSVLEFFGSLPLVLERSDLRVVHACPDDAMVALARAATNTRDFYEVHRQRIEAELDGQPDPINRKLAHQNRNPVKLLTSGPERRAAEPFWAGGKWRQEERVKWWEHYAGEQLCVFGHYSAPRGKRHGSGNAICADYAVGHRWGNNGEKSSGDTSGMNLAAVRFPEKLLFFDDGQKLSLSMFI